jgi:hypothetical protein
MADTRERRPRPEGGAPDDAHGDGSVNVIVRDASLIAADMRRRRDAALRLPPFGDGCRDPLDELAGLPINDPGDVCRGMFAGNGRWVPCCGRGAA